MTDWLLKDGRTHTSKVVREGTPQAKKAILHYMVLKEQNGYSLISVQLETGRSHQIRVQMSHAGHPLVGDQRYGVGSEPGIQIALWSYEMTFLHPVQKKPITVTAPLPDRWPWSVFEAEKKSAA